MARSKPRDVILVNDHNDIRETNCPRASQLPGGESGTNSFRAPAAIPSLAELDQTLRGHLATLLTPHGRNAWLPVSSLISPNSQKLLMSTKELFVSLF